MDHDLSALVGSTVVRVSFGSGVRLDFTEGRYPNQRVQAEMVIETPFRFRQGPSWYYIEPDEVDTLSPAVQLLAHKVESAGYRERLLSMSFDGGLEMAVPTSDKYETWSLQGRGVPQILVAMED
jgi:hypothetical protein